MQLQSWGILFCLASTQPALAWECRNVQLEITCARGKCERSNSFTPMHVSVSERGQVSACAYSGCWNGRAATLQRSARYLYVSGSFRWTGTTGEKEDLAVVIDRKLATASFLGAGFANPMTC